MIAIEINDTELTVHRGAERLVASPGFARLEAREIIAGAEAAARARLDPVRTEHEFWHRFGRDELRRSYRVARSQADLAYRHLEHVWHEAGRPEGPVVLLVPSDFRRDQIALLLGMARRLAIDVRAVVDAAIAASTRPRPGRHLFHLDLHLHRAVLSILAQETGPGATLRLDRATYSLEAGWIRVLDAWADAVARVFVQHTRFDPMHDATVEQRLRDQLAGWADALRLADEVAVSLEDAGRRFDARLGRSAIVAAADPVYRRLVALVDEARPPHAAVTLQLAHRAGHLPGLVERLCELPHVDVVVLPDDASVEGLAALDLPAPDDAGVPVVTSRAWSGAATDGTPLPRRRVPTHWVLAGVARPLGRHLRLGPSGRAASDGEPAVLRVASGDEGARATAEPTAGATLNGRPLADVAEPVSAGDRLRADRHGLDVLLIAVDGDGP